VEFAETVPAHLGTDDSYSRIWRTSVGVFAFWETALAPVPTLPTRAKMLRIYIRQDDRWEGKPLYEQIVMKIRERHAAGATVHKGAMGYGATQRVHPSGRFGLSRDLPVMITVVDSEDNVRALLPLLDSMVTEGLVVLSDVEVVKHQHGAAER
jgi:PII-like signaling protein